MPEGYRFLANPGYEPAAPYDDAKRGILSLGKAQEAFTAIKGWAGYEPTPLRDLPSIAAQTGVGQVLYKDEGARFGLGSFKALGGAYAVDRIVAARGGAEGLTVTCATDGNHGRSVAWGARRAGAKAVIYVHEAVSEGRAAIIRSFGAVVRREGAHYDASVHACTEAAAREGWQIVSDTSWPGYDAVPKDVMQGYGVLALEAEAQGAAPTHVFIQGGVGGVAAALLSVYWEKLGPNRPKLIVVEPENAACLLESARAGEPTAVTGDLSTIIAGLACGEPSLLAWALLGPGAQAFMTISDAAAEAMMRALAALHIVGGESGVAGLAGFAAVAADPVARAALGLDARSRILCIGTEGATDPAIYAKIVGKTPEEVVR